jgi:hypothetical protein
MIRTITPTGQFFLFPPDVHAKRLGFAFEVIALTTRARKWIKKRVARGVSWPLVEPRYFHDMAEGMQRDGLFLVVS